MGRGPIPYRNSEQVVQPKEGESTGCSVVRATRQTQTAFEAFAASAGQESHYRKWKSSLTWTPLTPALRKGVSGSGNGGGCSQERENRSEWERNNSSTVITPYIVWWITNECIYFTQCLIGAPHFKTALGVAALGSAFADSGTSSPFIFDIMTFLSHSLSHSYKRKAYQCII